MSNINRVRNALQAYRNNPDPGAKQTPKYTYIYLSADAWKHLQQQTELHAYKGRGPGQGTSAYLEALFIANANITDWTDARPQALCEYDLARLKAGLLPMWFEDDVRQIRSMVDQRTIRQSAFDTILPSLLDLSNHFGIKSRTQITARSDGNCVLEAIGLNHLSPNNKPERCPNERSTSRAIWYETRKRLDAKTKEMEW